MKLSSFRFALAGFLPLFALQAQTNPETLPAPGYDAPPGAIALGGATVAAYPPPHEQLEAPSADSNTINNNFTYLNLTRPRFLNASFIGADGKPTVPLPTTDWWTSVLINGDNGKLWQYPITSTFIPSGLEIQQIKGAIADSNGRYSEFEDGAALRIGGVERAGTRIFTGLPAEVNGWSDWMVKVRKTDSTNAALRVDYTLVRNMPYVWAEFTGLDPSITFGANPMLVFRDASGATLSGSNFGAHDRISVQVEGRYYGLHVPPGTVFTYASGRLRATLPSGTGQNYLVVSMLPSLADLTKLDACAYARPEKTTVTYTYNPASAAGGAVRTTWKYEVTPLKTGATQVIQGWLPPHYRETGASLGFVSGLEYVTPRGLLRCGQVQAATGFSINYPFNGILGDFAKPVASGLPNGFDPAYMEQLLLSYDSTHTGVADDTYFGAKDLVKHARAMRMAKDLGLDGLYQNLKAEIIASLTDWFTYNGTEQNRYFALNDRWGHIIGYDHRPDFNLPGFTDVHFHYGYYTLAYALVAMEDAAFRDRFKEIAITLARDYANWERPTALRDASGALQYPWMRTFEPMVGHSYAGGSGGNNQESSSEAIQSWAGMFLLGEVLRGNDPRSADIMAAAAFGYAIETRAVNEYYQDYHASPFASARKDKNGAAVTITSANALDTSNGNWPAQYRYENFAQEYPSKKAWVFTNGIMQDGANNFTNYFDAREPASTYGIQWLPNAPHMMFLARDPKFVAGQFDTLFKYRGTHKVIDKVNALRSSVADMRTEWHRAINLTTPSLDSRVRAINNGFNNTTTPNGMKWIIRTLFELNPEYVRRTTGNPLFANDPALVTFPDANTIAFPADKWTPQALEANNPQLVPPATASGLPGYALEQWVNGFYTYTAADGDVGPDWSAYDAKYGWNPANYSARDSAASISGLITTLQTLNDAWPLVVLCYDGFAEPDFALKVMAEYRRLGLPYATDTEANMFFYYYLNALQGLGTIQTDQHLGIATSAVFKTAANDRSYMVTNKSPNHELVSVYQNNAVVGEVVAYANATTLQRGAYPVNQGFSAIAAFPADNATGVRITQNRVSVFFSQPFNPAHMSQVTLTGSPGIGLTYQPGAAGSRIAEFVVQGDWKLGTTYTIAVPATVGNAAGTGTLGTNKLFRFTIQSAFGLKLTGTTPAASATPAVDSGTTRQIELSFNSRVSSTALSGVTVSGTVAGSAHNPGLTYDVAASTPYKAVLKLGTELAPSTTYTLTIPGSLTDVYGQTLGATQTITFTTLPAQSVLSDWTSVVDWSKFTVLASSGETTSTVSGARIWAFDTIGDYVTLQIGVGKGGTYNLKGVYRQSPDRGTTKLILNGAEVPNKLWNQTIGTTPATYDFGSVRLEPGLNTFRFQVTALSASAKGQFSVINLQFTPEQIDPDIPTGPYAEANGLVAFEAEDFMGSTSVTVGGVVREWTLSTARAGYQGTGSMRTANAGVSTTTNLPTTSPRLDYDVSFSTPGTYRVWVRGDAAGGDPDDSVHIGLDGVVGNAKDITLNRAASFVWSSTRMNTTAVATVAITSAGVHTISLWMREDGAYVDRIVLSLDQAYVPTGAGPAISGRVGGSSAPAAASSAPAPASSSTSTANSGSSDPSTTFLFAEVGDHDYLLAPDFDGTALNVDYLLLPGLNAGEYVTFDGTQVFTALPELTVSYDLVGDNRDDYYDAFSHDQDVLLVPDVSYSLAGQTFTVRYQKAGAGWTYRLYRSFDAVTWSAVNMAQETYNASTGFHQYVFPWTRTSGVPLFLRIQVSKP